MYKFDSHVKHDEIFVLFVSLVGGWLAGWLVGGYVSCVLSICMPSTGDRMDC